MNPFATLALPEKAALSTEEIRQAFQEASRRLHPDAPDGDAAEFEKLNRAHEQLQSPARRLRELLALRFAGEFSAQGSVPSELVEIFSDVGGTLSLVDAVLAKKRSAQSALAAAMLATPLLEAHSRLENQQEALAARTRDWESRLAEIDQMLETDPSSCLDAASVACRALLYLERWRDQLRARYHQLLGVM